MLRDEVVDDEMRDAKLDQFRLLLGGLEKVGACIPLTSLPK